MSRTAQIEIQMVTTYDEDSHPNDYLFQDPDYRKQDQARLKAWENDEWHFIGVRAKATIKIPFGIDCWITSQMVSPGLWGLESDSGDQYLALVYQEEKDTLLGMLESLKTYEVLA